MPSTQNPIYKNLSEIKWLMLTCCFSKTFLRLPPCHLVLDFVVGEFLSVLALGEAKRESRTCLYIQSGPRFVISSQASPGSQKSLQGWFHPAGHLLSQKQTLRSRAWACLLIPLGRTLHIRISFGNLKNTNNKPLIPEILIAMVWIRA